VEELEPYTITANGVEGDLQPDQDPEIIITNTSSETLRNIRLMLSPELKGKFLLSEYAIRTIPPDTDFTVSLRQVGNPHVDEMGNPLPYVGEVIISVGSHTPTMMQVSLNPPNTLDARQSVTMESIVKKAEERYRSLEKAVENIPTPKPRYEVTLASGESMITNASDELIITNTGDKPLKNLRIHRSTLSDQFLLSQNNIPILLPGETVSVKLISKLDSVENPSNKDMKGELLIVPANDLPMTLTVDIRSKPIIDKNSRYEVKTISENDVIKHIPDGIIIRNNSNETLDSVRIMLSNTLLKRFSLSEDSFKIIEPDSEKAVYLNMRGTPESKAKLIQNDQAGDIIVLSADGMKKTISVDMVWQPVSSENFTIYARDTPEELAKAAEVVDFLESSYSEITNMTGESSSKTVIYMTTSLGELWVLRDANVYSIFVIDEDVGFIWSNSEDVKMLALKEFVYRTIVQNHPPYWATEKISFNKGNWLFDGLANYIAARTVNQSAVLNEQLDSFRMEPITFEFVGQVTESKYGATYTFFKYLDQKYGDVIFERILHHMRSGMVSSHKCSTYEECILLRAVYDAKGLDMDEKKHDLRFSALIEEWKGYVFEQYGIENIFFPANIVLSEAGTTIFRVGVADTTFDIKIISEGIYSMSFSQEEKSITLESDGTGGLIEVAIPKELLGGEFTVMIDGNEEPIEFDVSETETESVLLFDKPADSSIIAIQGTTVVPEFPAAITMFALAGIVALVLMRARNSKYFRRYIVEIID